jgi:FMN phosphatase YigB (HAD superfamily)
VTPDTRMIPPAAAGRNLPTGRAVRRMPLMRTLFIDFGNVLGYFDHTRAVDQLARHTDLTAAALDQAVYAGRAMDDYESGRLTTAEFYDLARTSGGLRCTEAEFVAAFADIFTRNDEVCDLVPALARRYRLVLASNTCDAHYARYSADYADVLTHFSALCTSHEARSRKPLPGFYAYCQAFAAAEPAECAFLDYLPKNIAAANEFGWKGLLYTPGIDLAAALAEVGVVID